MNAYIKEFDVLVVYTSGIATSATSQLSLLPFDKHPLRAHYNDAYAYFLKTCELQNITAAFTTTLDLDDEGNFKSFWVHEKNTWIKKDQLCKSNLIFDKFSPVNALQRKNRKKLFSHALITSFNHPETFSLFFDKQKTFDDLSDFTIPTVSIKNSDANLEIAYQQLSLLLKNHPNKDDFSNDLIVKDRYGAGGDNIHKMKKKQMRSKSFEILHDNNKSFVIQPFVNFNKGHGKGIFKGFVDIRIVFVGKNLIQSYIRKPKKADFKCNEHQGGSLQYISKKMEQNICLKMATQEIVIVIFFIGKNHEIISLHKFCKSFSHWWSRKSCSADY
jgi:hypothetical protein